MTDAVVPIPDAVKAIHLLQMSEASKRKPGNGRACCRSRDDTQRAMRGMGGTHHIEHGFTRMLPTRLVKCLL